MRILFASTQGAGHFGTLIPFVDAATGAGSDVLIVGPPTLKARGYPFREGAAPPDEILGPVWGRMPSLPPGQGDPVVIGIIFARLNVDAMLPTLVDAIEEWRPDLVVREASEYASAAAAEQHGVPHARVAVGAAAVEEHALAIAGPVLDERRPGLAQRVAAVAVPHVLARFDRSVAVRGSALPPSGRRRERRGRCPTGGPTGGR